MPVGGPFLFWYAPGFTRHPRDKGFRLSNILEGLNLKLAVGKKHDGEIGQAGNGRVVHNMGDTGHGRPREKFLLWIWFHSHTQFKALSESELSYPRPNTVD